MLQNRPLIFCLGTEGVLQADAANRISTWKDISGNKNDLVNATAAKQPYYECNNPDGFPFILCPKVLNTPGTGLATTESYINFPGTLNQNTAGTFSAVSPTTQAWTIAAIHASFDERLDSAGGRFVVGNSDAIGSFPLDGGLLGGANKGPWWYDGNPANAIARVFSCGWTFKAMSMGPSGVTFYEGDESFAGIGTPASVAVGSGLFLGSKVSASGAVSWYNGGSSAYRALAVWNRTIGASEMADIRGSMYEQTKLAEPEYYIFFTGDSETYGAGATLNRSWTNRILMPRNCAMRVNAASSGQTFADLTTNGPTRVDPYRVSTKKNILLPWAGINDRNTGRTAAQIIGNGASSDCGTYIAARRAAGTWDKIIVSTTPPGFSTEAELAELAYQWQAQYKNAGADALVDVRQWPRGLPISAYGANSDFAYYFSGDSLHYNNKGNYSLALLFGDAIHRAIRSGTRSTAPWYYG